MTILTDKRYRVALRKFRVVLWTLGFVNAHPEFEMPSTQNSDPGLCSGAEKSGDKLTKFILKLSEIRRVS